MFVYVSAQCKPGTFSSNGLNDAGSPCKLCPVGTYQAKLGSSSCTPCPQGMTTASKGSAALQYCAGRKLYIFFAWDFRVYN